MTEHPSLKDPPMRSSRNAAETMMNLNREITAIETALANVKNKTTIVETDLNSLDSIQILANLEQRFLDFTEKYNIVLDKLAVNADAEADFLAQAKEKMSKL